ncbi:bifunctional diguanylate cyclase/phosphodiesterase [Rhizobium sp. SL42]|uniref:bifunctional diguanylate cyclase/phosphodiesterase n=1 Tax=Rhizobium sp. SL42 TaxID=2806346 RepID=UPI001F16D8BD|nr:EAL domain-containing protein [Rhizobium sp. SL42]UJW74446.1 EAL domain-containing protein [Rhizobium sp. SL42]
MAEKVREKNWGALDAALQYYVPAIVVIAAVAIAMVYADIQKRHLHQENLRNQVAEELGLIRARLEGGINSNIQLVQGLIAVIETEPNIDQKRFSNLAARLFDTPHQLRHIALAPDFVVRFAYPLHGNEKAIGFDYRTSETQREVALQVRDTGRMAVTGPIDLVQGGRGLIVRYPVVVQNGKAARSFWGLMAAVIDMDKLYDYGGLNSENLGIEVSIVSTRGGASKMPFFGSPSVFQDSPVVMPISFGNESWQVAARPKAGWNQPAPDEGMFRFLMMIVGAMIVAPVVWVARLLRERQANIAVLRQRESELNAISHRLDLALTASGIGIWNVDLDTGELTWDHRVRQLYGLGDDLDSSLETWHTLLHPDDVDVSERNFKKAVIRNSDYVAEFRIIRPDGEIRHIRTFGTHYRDGENRRKMVGVNWDVTADIRLQQDLREAQRQTEQHNEALESARRHMEHNSLHDALTGLPNRRYLDQHIAAIDKLDHSDNRLTVLHMDLDRFKDINDTLGHGAGDAMLRHVAESLRLNVRDGDFVARIGGDEFVIVCFSQLGEEQYLDMGRRLISAINTPITYEGHECRVGASIGVATKTDRNSVVVQLLVNADIALYEAKRRGRNRVERFSDQLRAQTVNTKKTADAILRSLAAEEFIPYFQPQFDAHTLEINGVEALARWQHPQRGILAPHAFLDIAESLNVVSQIDATILDQALFQLTRWRANDLGVERVSVNISAQRLFEDTLLERLDTLTLEPGSLSFELLESISFDDKGDAIAQSIERIRAYGIDIEIDDFGTGYASILSLVKLSPSRLKIDRQLTAPIVTNVAQRRLISSIVDIGRSLGIGIVAEGVETMEHAAILRDLGCHTLQGYALARPMSGDAFIDFARRHAQERNGLLLSRA